MSIQLTQDIIQKSTKPMVIDAFASWCPHCTRMKPIFAQLEKELGQQYTFAEFDVDLFPELTEQFNVESLPTFIFIKNKKEVGRVMGEMAQDELKGNVEKHLS